MPDYNEELDERARRSLAVAGDLSQREYLLPSRGQERMNRVIRVEINPDVQTYNHPEILCDAGDMSQVDTDAFNLLRRGVVKNRLSAYVAVVAKGLNEHILIAEHPGFIDFYLSPKSNFLNNIRGIVEVSEGIVEPAEK